MNKTLAFIVSSLIGISTAHSSTYYAPSDYLSDAVAVTQELEVQIQFPPKIRAQDYKTAYQQINSIVSNPYNIYFNINDGSTEYTINNIPSVNDIIIPDGGTLMIFRTNDSGLIRIYTIPVENVRGITYTQ